LARPPRSQPPRSGKRQPYQPKRFVSAGLLVREGLDARELEQVSAAFRRQSVALAPLGGGRQSVAIPDGEGGDMILMAIGGVAEVASGAVSGLIATGAGAAPSGDDQALLRDAVRAAHRRGSPVLALSDAAQAALEAIDHPSAGDAPAAILIYRGVHAVDAEGGLDKAAELFRAYGLGEAA
jgi:hypothetical protein